MTQDKAQSSLNGAHNNALKEMLVNHEHYNPMSQI